MSETYREEQEANIGESMSESVAHRFIKGLEDEIGVPNAFGSNDLEDLTDEEDKEEHEYDRDAEDLEDESNIPEGYGDDGYIN